MSKKIKGAIKKLFVTSRAEKGEFDSMRRMNKVSKEGKKKEKEKFSLKDSFVEDENVFETEKLDSPSSPSSTTRGKRSFGTKDSAIDLRNLITLDDPTSITSTSSGGGQRSMPEIQTSSLSSLESLETFEEEFYEVEGCVRLSQVLLDQQAPKESKQNFYLTKSEKKLYMKLRIDPKTIFVPSTSVKNGFNSASINGFYRFGLKRVDVHIKRYDLVTCAPSLVLEMVDTMHHMSFNQKVIDVFGCFFFKCYAYVIVEFHEIGNIAYNLKKTDSSFSKERVLERVSILEELVDCLIFINNDGYIHRDLTSFNVWITNSGNIKISGFIHAKKMKELTFESNLEHKVISRYAPPEMFDLVDFDEEYDVRCIDVYSFGVIMWEVLSGKSPFMNINELSLEPTLRFVHENRLRPPITDIEEYPKELVELTKKCWSFLPKDRPDWDEIKLQLREIRQKVRPPDVDKTKDVLESEERREESLRKERLGLSANQMKRYDQFRISPDSLIMRDIILRKGNVTLRRGFLKIGIQKRPILIKEVLMNRINSTREAMLKEVEMMCKLENENVLHCYGMHFPGDGVCRIVVDLCKMNTVMDYLPRLRTVKSKLNTMMQIARGMEGIHKMNYVHRNLNTGNMLIYYEKKDVNCLKPIIKIVDFKTLKKAKDVKSSEFVGKPPYIPPELCNLGKMRNPYLIDVYSFGVIMWEIWTGSALPMTYGMQGTGFVEDENFVALAHQIHSKKIRPDVTEKAMGDKCPKELVKLMKECWDHNQNKRVASFAEILKRLTEILKESKKSGKKKDLAIIENLKFDLSEETRKIAEKCIIDDSLITHGKVIGKGARGVVKKGWYRLGFGKIEVAVKEIQIEKSRNVTAESVLKEILLIHECDHIHVMKCFGIYFKENSICLVVELCEVGDVYSYVRNRKKKFSKNMKISMLLQIAKGMMYLHTRGIVHRDLKTQNCLIGNDKNIKICDFDTAKHAVSIGESICGTPELFEYSPNVDIKLVDIYSFGIIIWEVWMRRMPFQEIRKKFAGQPMQMIHTIHRENVRPSTEKLSKRGCPEELVELCTSCWSLDPHDRPRSFDTVVDVLVEVKENLNEK